MGTVWCASWLFTIGFLHLGFWKGILAIVLWPYYLGLYFRALARSQRLKCRDLANEARDRVGGGARFGCSLVP